MGQLEKYGLYVLCLVIFLILGVTIWGGGDLPQNLNRGKAPTNSDLLARTASNAPLGKTGQAEVVLAPDIEALLRPADRPKSEPKKDEPKKGEAKPVEASGGKNSGTGGEAGKPVAPKPETALPPPTEVARKTHKIQSGDSFESISKQHFGSAALLNEIARLNSRLVPTKLKPGTEVLLPTAAEALVILERGKARPASQPLAAATGTYRVVRGDTLEGIAIHQLGSRTRVADLQELNPGITPTLLKAGSVLKLPKK